MKHIEKKIEEDKEKPEVRTFTARPIYKPISLVIGPDGLVYTLGVKKDDFDKRYFGR